MILNITVDILRKLKKEGFYSDTSLTQFIVMLCFKTNTTDLLDELDDSYKSKRLVVLYYELLKRGFLEKTEDKFQLTEKGHAFIDQFIEPEKKPIVQQDISEWFDEWMDLFPKGVKTGGKLVRSDKQDCLKKMKQFMTKYKYSVKTIMNVTRDYISEFEKNDYQFIKSATYFIDKRGEGSELAARCQDYKDQPKEEIHTYNSGLI